MSKRNRHGKSASKLAAALCLISSGTAAAGEIAPTIVKTTTPIRVRSAAVPTTGSSRHAATIPTAHREESATPVSRSSVEQTSRSNDELRVLLEPDRSVSLNPHMSSGELGAPRTNQFVELRSERPSGPPVGVSTTRSAAVPQRNQTRRGTIQKNPLVVDTPPSLRRFGVDEVPLVLPPTTPTESPADFLVAREQPLPARPVEDLDETLDILSIQDDDELFIRGAARDSGFGMLAIDQIGQNIGSSADGDAGVSYAPVQRYGNDLVLPNGLAAGLLSSELDDSLRQQLSTVESNNLVEDDVPPLPSPRHSVGSDLSNSVSTRSVPISSVPV
ncbi:MAG: hypothetical protein KDB00_13645, partial [Planctomycetales bacterium]|nr:hypothetical protein [Planctomycetales bacterium]